MRVDEIMLREVRGIEPSASIAEAAAVMKNEGVTSLLVIKDDRLLGIVADADILWAVANGDSPSDHRVWEAMSPQPPVTSSASDVYEVVKLMNKHRVRWVPVVDDGRIVGTISIADVAACLELTV